MHTLLIINLFLLKDYNNDNKNMLEGDYIGIIL